MASSSEGRLLFPRMTLLNNRRVGAHGDVGAIATAIVRIDRESGLTVVFDERNARLARKLAHHDDVFAQGQILRCGSGSMLLADPFVRTAGLGL